MISKSVATWMSLKMPFKVKEASSQRGHSESRVRKPAEIGAYCLSGVGKRECGGAEKVGVTSFGEVNMF